MKSPGGATNAATSARCRHPVTRYTPFTPSNAARILTIKVYVHMGGCAMLTPFGRQVVTATVALLFLAALIYLFFLTSQGRVLTGRGRDFACQQAKICVE